MTTATAFATSPTIEVTPVVEQDAFAELDTSFSNLRGRIALLSIEATGTVTNFFSPVGPLAIESDIADIADVAEVIDIDAIEFEQFELELAPVLTGLEEQDAMIDAFIYAAA